MDTSCSTSCNRRCLAAIEQKLDPVQKDKFIKTLISFMKDDISLLIFQRELERECQRAANLILEHQQRVLSKVDAALSNLKHRNLSLLRFYRQLATNHSGGDKDCSCFSDDYLKRVGDKLWDGKRNWQTIYTLNEDGPFSNISLQCQNCGKVFKTEDFADLKCKCTANIWDEIDNSEKSGSLLSKSESMESFEFVDKENIKDCEKMEEIADDPELGKICDTIANAWPPCHMTDISKWHLADTPSSRALYNSAREMTTEDLLAQVENSNFKCASGCETTQTAHLKSISRLKSDMPPLPREAPQKPRLTSVALDIKHSLEKLRVCAQNDNFVSNQVNEVNVTVSISMKRALDLYLDKANKRKWLKY